MNKTNKPFDINNLRVEKLATGVYRDLDRGTIISYTTDVYKQMHDAYFKEQKTILVLCGSTRSTKTYSSVQFIIDLCMANKLKVNILRKTRTLSERGVALDFRDIMCSRELYNINNHNLSSQIYTFPETGSEVSFLVVGSEGDAKGIKQDIFVCEEAVEIDFSIYMQLKLRTSKLTIITYNPTCDDNHWINKTLLQRDENGELLDKNVKFIHSTYRCNPFLSKENIRAIESLEPTPENIASGSADAVKWKIFGLGEYAEISGKIYEYEIVDELPKDLEYVCYGVDFGYSPDCTTLVFKGEKQQIINGTMRNCLYLHECIYETGLITTRNIANPEIPSIQSRMEELKIDKSIPIYADSASPDQIRDLQISGYNIMPVVKTQGGERSGSISYGIGLVQSYKMFITSESINLKKELDFYRQEKRGDKIVRIGADHILDASRYAVISSSPLAYYSSRSKDPVRVKMMGEDTLRKYG